VQESCTAVQRVIRSGEGVVVHHSFSTVDFQGKAEGAERERREKEMELHTCTTACNESFEAPVRAWLSVALILRLIVFSSLKIGKGERGREKREEKRREERREERREKRERRSKHIE
jgi:hypothetical protein